MNVLVNITDAGGRVCTQGFTLAVTGAACVNWANLLWGVPFIGTFGAGTASFSPNSVASASFDGIVDAPVTFFPNPDQAVYQNLASVVYNGPACNCNLHLVTTTIGPVGNLCANIIVGGGILSVDLNNVAAGTYDYPFTIPDTGGVPATINITANSSIPCINDPGPHLQLHVVGTFSNV